jgi:osmotically inducible protein OsmC
MSSLPPIAVAISHGGRSGSVETAESGFSLHFKSPAAGNLQGLTPEHLFGAAWAACFNGAAKHVAKQSGHVEEGITVTAKVQLHSEGSKPFLVELLVLIPNLEKDKAKQVVEKAHALCAYSKATKGNVDVKLTLV